MSSKIVTSRVTVSFETSSGYESHEEFMPSGANDSEALKRGLREIARVLTVNGEGDEAVALVAEAKAAVEKDLA